MYSGVRRITSFLCVIVLFVSPFLFSQNKPRIAVIPFNSINIAKADAETVTGLFETALVKTEAFFVVEQNQVNEILNAQEYSLADCTDEKCAIEFGKLLAAEQIVLGTLSTLGGKYVLNAKIIDVAEGRNIRADKVDVENLKDITDAAELLAYKLAGLTYSTGGEVKKAEGFGELFVETDPSGADIYINGVKKGVSPDVFSRIPIGTVRVEARKGDLYAASNAAAGTRMSTVKLTLRKTYGNLFVRSSVADVEVFMDGEKLGAIGSGLFQNLAAGDHTVTLRGDGVSWEGKISIEEGKTARVEANPRTFGSVSYSLPEGVQAEITGNDFREVVRGSGILSSVWAGNYRVKTRGGDFEPTDRTITVAKGETADFTPIFVLSPQAIERAYDERISAFERMLGRDTIFMQQYVDESMAIVSELKNEKHDFSGLVSRAEKAAAGVKAAYGKQLAAISRAEKLTRLNDELSALTTKRDDLAVRIPKAEAVRKSNSLTSWISLGVGVVSFAGMSVSLYFGNEAYKKYSGSTITSLTEGYRRDCETFQFINIGTGAVGGIAALLAVFLPSMGEDPVKLRAEFDAVDLRLRETQFKINALNAATDGE